MICLVEDGGGNETKYKQVSPIVVGCVVHR